MRAKIWLSCVLAALVWSEAYASDDLEEWVSRPYYEGLPLDRASELSAEEIEQLAALLDNPKASAAHGNILLALGASGHANAYAILVRYANSPPVGEVDRSEFRARTHLPLAMGHLARHDRRALRWLVRDARRADGDASEPASEPGWSFRHHRGEQLAALLEEACLSGLALSGKPEASQWIARAADAGSDSVRDNRRRRHARAALEVHDRVVTGGPAVLHGPHRGEER
jgi:hypothetical protein